MQEGQAKPGSRATRSPASPSAELPRHPSTAGDCMGCGRSVLGLDTVAIEDLLLDSGLVGENEACGSRLEQHAT